MIIEGEIDPAAPSVELGGIASPSGFYTIPRPAPAIEVTAITHRANAAFPAIVYGRPPTESNAVDRLAERLLLPTIQALAEEIVDLALPAFGGRSFVVVAIDKSYPQQAHKTAAAVWGCPALMTARTVVVVDRGVDVHDTQAVMFRVAANGRGGVDVAFPQGPAAPFDHAGGKLLIDATAKLPGEHAERWPDEIVCDEATRAVVEQRWQEYGLG
jgi:4-hydroxy-3-polyprenylbenzoate decarboxylase